MKAVRQTTLRDQIAVSGVGVHSGVPVTLTIYPADADTGIVFGRADQDREVRADYRSVTATELATVLGDQSGLLCSTAEHILAALRGLGVDNAYVELDGPEVPIMDGSAAPFVAAIDQVGVVSLNAPRRYIKILKPVRVAGKGDAFGELSPYADGFRLEVEINFDNPLIGRQSLALDLDPDTFRRELSRARTFGFMKDVSALWAAGKALGAGLENTVVMSESRVMNAEGLRFSDEFVRHKALDAVGDLALAGAPLLGCYRSVRGGHKMNHAVLTALMSDPTAWTLVEAEPVRRVRGHADVATGLVAPAYGPDVS
jgi:UDP-3-O-[3-hydroxymyristoyl] N-acetylglucosamine deacetylase